ncbi:MFS transporter [Olsenella uli]
MPALLLPIIYLAFISLGLPDSALGSAWPSMYGTLDAQLSWVGFDTAIISAGTIVSSVLSVRLVRWLGTGRVVVLSVALTAVGLVGFSFCTSFWQLCLLALPYGLGAGAIDAALNSYVAVHYATHHMSWLHCMWGIGASGGPLVMAQCLSATGAWNLGFRTIGIIQVAILAVLTLSLPLWKGSTDAREGANTDADKDAAERRAHGVEALPVTRLLALPGVKQALVCFFCYCALESTCGIWAASYCSLARGVAAEVAAGWASLFYAGITVGRALSGLLTLRFSDRSMIRLGQAVTLAGTALLLLPLGGAALPAGLIVIGLGCAPIYPSIIHATPRNFGERHALQLTGMQMAFAYVGSLAMPPLFGALAQVAGTWLYPICLAALLALMIVMAEGLNAAVAHRRAVS